MAVLIKALEAATVTVVGAVAGALFGHYIDSALWGGIYAGGTYLAFRIIATLLK